MANSNQDCVNEYDGALQRSECVMPDGTLKELRYTTRADGPGAYRLVQQNPSPADPVAAKERRIGYRLDDRWLFLEATPVAPPNMQAKVANKMLSVSVRVPPGPDGKVSCHPRGGDAPRMKRGARSSLALEVPPGYRALPLDLDKRPFIEETLHGELLVGEYVEQGAGDIEGGALTGIYVIVTDDLRLGPRVMKPQGFAAFKTERKGDYGPASCERDGVICFDRTPGMPGMSAQAKHVMVVAYVNVAGRVAVVLVSAPGMTRQLLDEARATAQLFAFRLQAGNP